MCAQSSSEDFASYKYHLLLFLYNCSYVLLRERIKTNLHHYWEDILVTLKQLDKSDITQFA